MPMHSGACHCGNVTVTFDSPKPLEALPLRACQCGFCRKHGVRTTSDPDATLSIGVRHPERIAHYEFGLRAAQFLICVDCGVYVAAVLSHGERRVATLNINVLDDDPFHGRTPDPAHYGSEEFKDRRARRLKMWTPTRLSLGAQGSEPS